VGFDSLPSFKQLAGRVITKGIRLFVGLTHPEFPKHYKSGQPFLYMDNAYWRREPRGLRFRLIHSGVHLNKVLDRPADRFEALNKTAPIVVEPWRKSGRTVVVIPPSTAQKLMLGFHNWEAETVAKLKAITDRPVFVKATKQESLRECLRKQDAWAVVTFASVAGLEAATWGYPVFATERCCAWPVSAGPLERIETPEYPDRMPWLHSLAYAQWCMGDLNKLNLEEYDYTCAS
jgi:hypothetical protein